MDRTIDALRAKDGRYGYNCKRGNCNDPSVDVASYFYANGDNIQGPPRGLHLRPHRRPLRRDAVDVTGSM